MRGKRFTAALTVAALLSTTLAPVSATAQDQGQGQTAGPMMGLGEGVAAVVNDELITTYELRQRMMLLVAMSRVQVTQENLRALQQQALNSLIDERLQLQELARYDVEITDDEVNQELSGMAAENQLTLAQFEESLRAANIDPQTMRDQIRAEIGWRNLVTGRYRTRARATNEQIEAVLQRITAAASKTQYLVGEIYLDAAAVGGMEVARQGGQQLFEQMVQGAPFQAVARQFSNAPSAANGGDMGWVLSGEISPELETALSQMRPGQLSTPIETRDGVYLLYLRDVQTGGANVAVGLKQAGVRLAADADQAAVDAATRSLERVRSRAQNCAGVEQAAEGADGVVVVDLGETSVSELLPDYAQAVQTLDRGQSSPVIRTSAGLAVLFVCSKTASGQGVPSREQVEARLFSQQLSMLERRYMRDLRAQATIEFR